MMNTWIALQNSSLNFVRSILAKTKNSNDTNGTIIKEENYFIYEDQKKIASYIKDKFPNAWEETVSFKKVIEIIFFDDDDLKLLNLRDCDAQYFYTYCHKAEILNDNNKVLVIVHII